MTDRRVQLSRSAGWRMPPNTRSVARPSMWGNPFRVGGYAGVEVVQTSQEAVDRFRALLEWGAGDAVPYPKPGELDRLDRVRERMLNRVNELVGMRLACWCPLGKPCHADVLLELVDDLGEKDPS